MKTQLEQQRLRLRIDEHELGRLLAGEAIDNITALAPGILLNWRLVLGAVETPELHLTHDVYRVRLPRDEFVAFANARPRRDGLSFEWFETGDAPLQVTVEIDVRDSHRLARASRQTQSTHELDPG